MAFFFNDLSDVKVHREARRQIDRCEGEIQFWTDETSQDGQRLKLWWQLFTVWREMILLVTSRDLVI